MEEKIFFESNDVKVTNSRFITGNQTYAMSNVTSVKPHKQSPNRMPWIFALCYGCIFYTNKVIPYWFWPYRLGDFCSIQSKTAIYGDT
ncbi:hypothetical protein RYY30_003524 [Vibrio cholerae]|uniref:hypothetical protein n=1 Tax=Vibrio cholerae TaxID=666 RepID=UPI0012B42CD2|nr:hypothetical protein [Vibrio cholerae]EGR0495346.1 hypothetical protein [Vibrio cholerae]EJS1626677.1 hypothetical protein [Vibrio cholerae]EKF9850396.1 hypothetical protein [Vibrio cholerae]ELM3769072.1 hypothetical protein [Vibrio cholerae]MDV2301250.1 hypothetical protein [Vibrio cholerae]